MKINKNVSYNSNSYEALWVKKYNFEKIRDAKEGNNANVPFRYRPNSET